MIRQVVLAFKLIFVNIVKTHSLISIAFPNASRPNTYMYTPSSSSSIVNRVELDWTAIDLSVSIERSSNTVVGMNSNGNQTEIPYDPNASSTTVWVARTNICDANDNYESKLSISMKDVPNDADVKIFKVAKRGPVSDIAIIDASNNNEVIPFDKPFDIYGWKNNTDTIYKVTLSPLTSNITLKLTGKIDDLILANGNDLKEGEKIVEPLSDRILGRTILDDFITCMASSQERSVQYTIFPLISDSAFFRISIPFS